MLVTLYRHGQSLHNAGLTDHLDSELTPLGKLQASATAKRLAQEGYTSSNTMGFVSPLNRTLQTFEPAAVDVGLPAEVFREVCEYFSVKNDGYKTFEGLSKDQIVERFPWALVGQRFGCEEMWWPQTQENVADLYARSCRVRDHLIANYYGKETRVVIVSHADPIGRMIESFLHVDPHFEAPPWSANCGVTKLLVTDPLQPAIVVAMNDISHLAAQSLATPA